MDNETRGRPLNTFAHKEEGRKLKGSKKMSALHCYFSFFHNLIVLNFFQDNRISSLRSLFTVKYTVFIYVNLHFRISSCRDVLFVGGSLKEEGVHNGKILRDVFYEWLPICLKC